MNKTTLASESLVSAINPPATGSCLEEFSPSCAIMAVISRWPMAVLSEYHSSLEFHSTPFSMVSLDTGKGTCLIDLFDPSKSKK